MSTVAVIGLGIIGSVWARHYQREGVLRAVWNRSAKSDWPEALPSLADVTRKAEVFHVVVADPPAVQSVLDVLKPGLRAGMMVVQSSTIDPESSERFRALVESTGADYLEAPFTGSKPAAEARKTVFYLGGDEALIAKVEPLLVLISEHRFHIGSNRQAATLKLAMNLNIAAQMQGLCEALTLVRSAGVSDDTFFSALQKNVSYSGVAALKEPKLRNRDYTPQFSVKHLLKDLRLATRTIGCEEYPVLDTLRDRLHLADQQGRGDEDFSVLIELFSKPRV